MEQKIQELTVKIYNDGVQKGEEKARALVVEAEKKAASLLAKARTDAEKILAEASTRAEELKRNTESEIRLSGSQAIASIKQQITELVCAEVIDTQMANTLSNPAYVKEFITLILQKWHASAEAIRLEALLPAQKQQEFTDAFKKGVSDHLKKELTLTFSKSVKAGFRIGPQNGSFKISLTDEDFAEFFKEFLRPKTRAWLFGEQ